MFIYIFEFICLYIYEKFLSGWCSLITSTAILVIAKLCCGGSSFIIACLSRFLLLISYFFVAAWFFHVLHSGEGWGEFLRAGANRQCLHLQTGQTARALEVRLLHVPTRWVSLVIFLVSDTRSRVYSRPFFFSSLHLRNCKCVSREYMIRI